MRNSMVAGLAVFLFMFAGGCYKMVVVHPEKSEAQFYGEKKICEKKARDYAVEMREDWSASDEISHTRRCMQENGWNYRFRN
ncbi:MAG: hypothetical protein KKC20_06090 [Proteobacteria bacterium]|nr:hypothetical protein [Pseudomonadota bacterium]